MSIHIKRIDWMRGAATAIVAASKEEGLMNVENVVLFFLMLMRVPEK